MTKTAVSTILSESTIWSPTAVPGVQCYVGFRRVFELESRPDSAVLHIFADSRYLLWVNGRHVLRGPARFHPGKPEYDSIEIGKHLRHGRNAIVVLVHHYAGVTNGRIMRHDPGLTACLILEGCEHLRTDPFWVCSDQTEYRPSPGAWSSIPDVIDARCSPGDWTGTDFDDSKWNAAVRITGGSWGGFRERITPLCREEEITCIHVLPERHLLDGFIPLELAAVGGRRWIDDEGKVCKWMWPEQSSRIHVFRAVWSNAGFGVGHGSKFQVRCDRPFEVFLNQTRIGSVHGPEPMWCGVVDVADGDVLVIRTVSAESPGRPAILISLNNEGNLLLDTRHFSSCGDPLSEDGFFHSDAVGFSPLLEEDPVDSRGGSDTGKSSLVLDLGRMAMAYPAVEFEGDEGSVLQMEYALRWIDGRTAECYGVGTTYIARAGRQKLLAADQWCARYVTLRCLAGRVRVHSFRMIERRYPYERVGSFQCGDDLLSRLWEMAVRTVEVTTDDAHGSDARERNEWVQDASKASFRTMCVAAIARDRDGNLLSPDPRTLRKVISDAAACQMPDGRLPGTFPTDRGPEDPHHFIDDYAMQWVEALRWHHELTGDDEFTREMWPALVRQMAWFLERVTSRGLLHAREYTSFDNPIAYMSCEGATVNAFFHLALTDAAWLAAEIGFMNEAGRYRAAAMSIASAFNGLLWCETEGACSAGLLDGEKLPPSVHAQLMALYSGVVDREREERSRAWFIQNFRNPGASLVIGPKADFRELLDQRAGLGMTIMFYWALTELFRMDTAEADRMALAEIRNRWRNMVEFLEDAGTLSESFVNDCGGGMSESCHNYGAVPAYFLSSYVLGVRTERSDDGWRLVINPRRADLLRASGFAVTRFGLVSLEWVIDGNVWRLEVGLPDGVPAEIRLAGVKEGTLIGGGAELRGIGRRGRNCVFTGGPGRLKLQIELELSETF